MYLVRKELRMLAYLYRFLKKSGDFDTIDNTKSKPVLRIWYRTHQYPIYIRSVSKIQTGV